MSHASLSPSEGVTLWIGGTSSLARTFFVNYDNIISDSGQSQSQSPPRKRKWILTGLEAEPPQWIESLRFDTDVSIKYVPLDLTSLTTENVTSLFGNVKSTNNITSMVIAVRPLLFDAYIYTDQADRMLNGLQVFVEQAVLKFPSLRYILHISSVAAADHLRTQCNATEPDPLPPLSEYHAPYDRFKRCSEDMITKICRDNNSNNNNKQISCCHLRLSAIFSDDRACIQCSALDLQARVGCYLPLAIDCNSSLNVAKAINLLLNQAATTQHQPQNQVFHYTRPLALREPVPYGHYLNAYRSAYEIQKSSIWIPVWMVTGFVAIVHLLATWNQKYLRSCVPYLDAADYLLQVAAREHSFDNSAFRNFVAQTTNGEFREENIFVCFVRRKFCLQGMREYINK